MSTQNIESNHYISYGCMGECKGNNSHFTTPLGNFELQDVHLNILKTYLMIDHSSMDWKCVFTFPGPLAYTKKSICHHNWRYGTFPGVSSPPPLRNSNGLALKSLTYLGLFTISYATHPLCPPTTLCTNRHPNKWIRKTSHCWNISNFQQTGKWLEK